MSEVEEIKEKIEYCRTAVEPYRVYSNLVAQGINDLNKLEELVSNPTDKNLRKALEIVTKLDNLVSPYASFLPDAAKKFREIKTWLEKRAKKG